MTVPKTHEVNEIIQRLSQEFLVDAGDALDQLGAVVEGAREDAGGAVPALHKIRREAHNLKGLGGSFGFPSITLIAHRLEDYLNGLDTVKTRHLDDVLEFLDRMQEIIEHGVNPGNVETSRILRELPAKGAADENFRPTNDHEILLVAASCIVGRAVEAQLHSRGYRVVTVKSPIEAFEIAIRTRPDMIIASAVMECVGGVDLACALKAMSMTRDIPFVLLTGFVRSHSELRRLPGDVDLIHHDRDLEGEVSKVLQGLGILPP